MRPLLAALVLAAAAAPAFAQTYTPPPHGETFLADDAGLLDAAARERVEELAHRVAEEDGVTLAVLTLRRTDGVAPKKIAVDTLNVWRVGRRSVLLLVCMEPHELYIQPGTDLNSVFDELTSSAICHDTIAPVMRTGAYGKAVETGLAAIVARLQVRDGSSTASEDSTASQGSSMVRTSISSISTSTVVVGASDVIALGIIGTLTCGVPLALIALVVFIISRIVRALRRKCPKCQVAMRSSSRTLEAATYASHGRGETTYSCTTCGFSEVVPYTISMLSDTSSNDTSSSSSSISSDGSGGGGSSW
jgi:uncharacterized membrane protein YgcG